MMLSPSTRKGSFMHIIGEAQTHIASLLETLDEQECIQSELGSLHTVVEGLFGESLSGSIAVQSEIADLLNSYHNGSNIPAQLESLCASEMKRSGYLLRSVDTISLQFEQFYELMMQMRDSFEYGEPWPVDALSVVDNDMKLMMECISSMGTMIKTPSKRLDQAIYKMDSRMKPHVQYLIGRKESSVTQAKLNDIDKGSSRTNDRTTPVTTTTTTTATTTDAAAAALQVTKSSGGNVATIVDYANICITDSIDDDMQSFTGMRVYTKADSMTQTDFVHTSDGNSRLNSRSGSAMNDEGMDTRYSTSAVYDRSNSSNNNSISGCLDGILAAVTVPPPLLSTLTGGIGDLQIVGMSTSQQEAVPRSGRRDRITKQVDASMKQAVLGTGYDSTTATQSKTSAGTSSISSVSAKEVDRKTRLAKGAEMKAMTEELYNKSIELDAREKVIEVEINRRVNDAIALYKSSSGSSSGSTSININDGNTNGNSDLITDDVDAIPTYKTVAYDTPTPAATLEIVGKKSSSSTKGSGISANTLTSGKYTRQPNASSVTTNNSNGNSNTLNGSNADTVDIGLLSATSSLIEHVVVDKPNILIPPTLHTPREHDNTQPLNTSRTNGSDYYSYAKSMNDTLASIAPLQEHTLLRIVAPTRKEKGTNTDNITHNHIVDSNVRTSIHTYQDFGFNDEDFDDPPYTEVADANTVTTALETGTATGTADLITVSEVAGGAFVTKTYKKHITRTFKDEMKTSSNPLLLLYDEYGDILPEYHKAKLLNIASNDSTSSNIKFINIVFRRMQPHIEAIEKTLKKIILEISYCEKMSIGLITLSNDGINALSSTVYKTSVEQLTKKIGLIEVAKLWCSLQLVEYRTIYDRSILSYKTMLPQSITNGNKVIDMIHTLLASCQCKMVEATKRLDDVRHHCDRYNLVGGTNAWTTLATTPSVSKKNKKPNTSSNSGNNPTSNSDSGSSSYIGNSSSTSDGHLALVEEVVKLEAMVERLSDELKEITEEKDELNIEIFKVMQEKDRTPAALLFYATLQDTSAISSFQQLVLQLNNLKGFADCSVHIDYATLRKRMHVCINSLPSIERFIHRFQSIHKKWLHKRLSLFIDKGMTGGNGDNGFICPICDHDSRNNSSSSSDSGSSSSSGSRGVTRRDKDVVAKQRQEEVEDMVIKRKIDTYLQQKQLEMMRQLTPSVPTATTILNLHEYNTNRYTNSSSGSGSGSIDDIVFSSGIATSTSLPSLTRKKLVATIKMPVT